MYSDLRIKRVEEQVEQLTQKLVGIRSYNGTDGENEKAEWLLEAIKTFPYFKENPELVWAQQLVEDPLGRKNVFALIKNNTDTKKTIIYNAHYDTVGTEDFGPLQDIAHDPEKLQDYFSHYDADEEVQNDALSGEWFFGRGSLDMQSGIAVHLVNLLYFSENLNDLPGNLLVMLNPDEESQHTGIRGSLAELVTLREKLGLEYLVAINNDFISPLFDGDDYKYIYTGTAGKLLPCFYIFGREAHVGDSLSSIDPTLISSEINFRIGQNFDLVEPLSNELVLPPTCLFLRDDKKSYDVQTAVSAKLYFNYFVYEKSPNEVLEDLKKITEEVCQSYNSRQHKTYVKFRTANGLPERDLDWTIEVTTLEEHIQYLKELGIEVEDIIKDALKKVNREEMDDRMVAFQLVEALHYADPEKKPKVILFYAPPFLPANFLSEELQENSIIYKKIRDELKQTEINTNEKFKLRKYFPYLSDGSFLSFNGSEEEIRSLKENFPAMDTLFPVPLKEMKSLNIPALNFGVYGKGGHKWTERVYKPYSFGVLPLLIRRVTKRLLED